MGCPAGTSLREDDNYTRSVFTHAFLAKRELHCLFLRKKAIIITSKHGTTIFFPITIFFVAKLKDKLARKARVHMLSEYMGSCSCPPGHLIILLTSNKFNMAAVLVKRSNYLFLLQLDGRKD